MLKTKRIAQGALLLRYVGSKLHVARQPQFPLTPNTLVVTLCTVRFNIQEILCSAHTLFMCFVWFSEQTAIISLYSINWLVFTTETVCLLRGTT
jgi:hypothetical protein